MRRFLYISPFFPPLCRVGAFRPLKFARHMPDFGWQPIVLCDLWPGASTDNQLTTAIPKSTIVLRKYSKHATVTEKQLTSQSVSLSKKENSIPKKRIGIFAGREWLPMGDAVFNIPHALQRAKEAIEKYDCKAIMVNADPVAALLVGARLSKETGLPFIADLRDPWGPCELRLPLRPFYTRWIEKYFESKAVKQSSKVILNTNTTLDQYKKEFPNIRADKFTMIRNHGDKELIYSGNSPLPPFNKYTLLFLGSFSRFVKADPLLHLLVELKQKGISNEQFQLTLTSPLDYNSELLAKNLDVYNYISCIPTISYLDVGRLMDNADILTMILPTKQRIQAKFYDYLFSQRPILAISDSQPELSKILAETQSGELFHSTQISNMADFIKRFITQGRHPVLKRHPEYIKSYTSYAASEKLADVLDSVVI